MPLASSWSERRRCIQKGVPRHHTNIEADAAGICVSLVSLFLTASAIEPDFCR